MKIITKEQIRAARGLLGWSQTELAERVGVSRDLISKVEMGTTSGSKTLEGIFDVFDREGIEFFKGNGLSRETISASVLNNYMDVLKDAMSVLNSGDEILFHCADDRRSSPEVAAFMNKMREAGVKMRSTICEGNTFILGSMDEYRWIDKNYFQSQQVQAIYSDRFVAHAQESGEDKFIFMHSKGYSDNKKSEFEHFWKTGKPCLDTET